MLISCQSKHLWLYKTVYECRQINTSFVSTTIKKKQTQTQQRVQHVHAASQRNVCRCNLCFFYCWLISLDSWWKDNNQNIKIIESTVPPGISKYFIFNNNLTYVQRLTKFRMQYTAMTILVLSYFFISVPLPLCFSTPYVSRVDDEYIQTSRILIGRS